MALLAEAQSAAGFLYYTASNNKSYLRKPKILKIFLLVKFVPFPLTNYINGKFSTVRTNLYYTKVFFFSERF